MRQGPFSLLGTWWRSNRGELEACRRELSESLERETATSQVLGIISSSPTDLEPVFETILANATRLCEASYGTLWLCEGDAVRRAALHGSMPPAFAAEQRRGAVFHVGRRHAMARAIGTRQTVHVADMRAEQSYLDRHPLAVEAVEIGGIRTLIHVPMLKQNEVVGVISIYRREVRPFTDKQIALVTNFASQAVIAIENARLLNELRESLEQQTATADVLKVISRSAFDLEPVLHTLAETAARLCGAEIAFILRHEGEVYRAAAAVGTSAESMADAKRYQTFLEGHPFAPGRGTLTGRVALESRAVQITDVTSDPEYTLTETATLGKIRTQLGVPLVREGSQIGVMIVSRQRVEPFTERQVDLVRAFADQAVIAIENVRLFDEVQARTRQLAQSLEFQTATSEVLKVISSSKFDLQPVLDTVIETAARLCAADIGAIRRRDGEAYQLAATFGYKPGWRAHVEQHSGAAGRGSIFGRTALERRTVHIPDVLQDPEWARPDTQSLMGFRAALGVPLLREENLIGVLILQRFEPGEFTPKQIELVQTFADQAVIAIENVRLFDEV